MWREQKMWHIEEGKKVESIEFMLEWNVRSKINIWVQIFYTQFWNRNFSYVTKKNQFFYELKTIMDGVY